MKVCKALIAALAAVYVVFLSYGAGAVEKKVVLSQAFQSLLYLSVYVGQSEGFFEQQNIALVIETAGSPAVALSAVISGSAQFSIHGPEWTAIAASKGAPVFVVSSIVSGVPVWMAAAPDVKVSSIKDLRGLKIVTGQMPTTSTSLLMNLMRANGLDPRKDVELM